MITPLTARVTLVAFMILVGLPLSLAVGATQFDGRYPGVISCDALPGVTSGRLRTDFLLKIIDGQAQYEREVLRPEGTQRLGVTERGTATYPRAARCR